MTFDQKIDTILKTNKLGINSISGLEDFCEAGRGTIKKLYTGETVKGLKTDKKIIDKLRINPVWWETAQGDVYLEDHNDLVPDVTESIRKPETIYQDLIENNTEYRLVPKTILDGEYRVVPKSYMDSQTRLIDQLADENKWLRSLYKEMKTDLQEELKGLRLAVHTKNA